MKLRTLFIVTSVLITSATLLRAQGCGTGSASGTGCCSGSHAAATSHAGHGENAPPAPAKTTAPKLALNGVAKPVFENYLAVQASLAGDSLETVSTRASAVAQAVRNDTAKTLPVEVAGQAEALAKAKDLAAARKAFRPLSESLIRFAKAGSIPAGTLYEVYCPMAKASWLQADQTVRNPYFGQAMLSCGQIKG